MENQGADQKTGTRDTTYNLTAVLYHALQGVENCKIYGQDAQGSQQQLQQFFEQAAQQQQQLAEQAKQLLHDCLMQETQGNQGAGEVSAFGFGQQQQGESRGSGTQQQQDEFSAGSSGTRSY